MQRLVVLVVCPGYSPTPPRLCCDLCSPAEFENEFVVSLENRKPQPPRSTMEPYEPSEDDKMLRVRLDRWRWKMADDIFGELFTNNFGCYTFMPNEVFNRICDAAHYDLITSIDTLAKETRWHLSKEHGQAVIKIISEMRPVTAPQSPPQTAAPASDPKLRELMCTSCGQPGHSSELASRTLMVN